MSIDHRVSCSTITLRHLPLREALTAISEAGFTEIDLGALPGVCDHVPYVLDHAAVSEVSRIVTLSGLSVRSINADVGDLNVPLDDRATVARAEHVDRLIDLCVAVGSRALVLPNGRQQHDPVEGLESDLELVARELAAIDAKARGRGIELWVEAPHWFRLVYDLDRTAALLDLLPPTVGVVCDVSHITASGSTPRAFLARFGRRTRHVHIRDAEPGYIHHSVGQGVVDFPDLVSALHDISYDGVMALELETRDTADAERAHEAQRVATYLSGLLSVNADLRQQLDSTAAVERSAAVTTIVSEGVAAGSTVSSEL
ncbi:sugar phosphate isomerase/epimerase family protein [Salinibacterium sp. PAMC 21357]|uniref:sugar phosphate isomerase/epimerase family protein n=1 Tax=Salinibacterium sp. PAMC 21357 TaxID=1112215 RepID=UPI00028A11B2|nr:sugar phosphate isomerase/epimerase [Salinibacterium sp. PAMC 21357]